MKGFKANEGEEAPEVDPNEYEPIKESIFANILTRAEQGVDQK